MLRPIIFKLDVQLLHGCLYSFSHVFVLYQRLCFRLFKQPNTKKLIWGFGFSPENKTSKASFKTQQLVPVLKSHTSPRHCSPSVSLCLSQTNCTAAVTLSTYMLTAQWSLLLETIKSHCGKYCIMLTEAEVHNASRGEIGTRKMQVGSWKTVFFKM